MNIDEIRSILVVGTGTMGRKTAFHCARFGYAAVAYDPVEKSLENVRAKISSFAAELVGKGRMTSGAST